MRTTLAIDDDVLAAARDLAAGQKKSVGEVISALARKALAPKTQDAEEGDTRNGVPLLPRSAKSAFVTTEMVKRLDDELP